MDGSSILSESTKLCRSSPRGGHHTVDVFQASSSLVYGAKFRISSAKLNKIFFVRKLKVDPVIFAPLAQLGERDTVTVEASGSKPLWGAKV